MKRKIGKIIGGKTEGNMEGSMGKTEIKKGNLEKLN